MLVIGLVAEAVNVRWIDGKFLDHVLVGRKFFDETPVPDLVDGEARDFDGSLLSENRKRSFQVGWTRRRRCLDDPERAVAELQRGDRRVFGFDLCQRRHGAGVYADDLAEEPLQHVDMVAGLVRENTAV